jgi:hypothetical protein
MSRAKAALDRLMIKYARQEAKQRGNDPAKVAIAPWIYHDLRRTMATGMARLGIQLPVIERCLNHISGTFSGVQGIYQRHSFASEKVMAFDAWSSAIEAIVFNKTENVISLKARIKS